MLLEEQPQGQQDVFFVVDDQDGGVFSHNFRVVRLNELMKFQSNQRNEGRSKIHQYFVMHYQIF
jgi:hypothetical protein